VGIYLVLWYVVLRCGFYIKTTSVHWKFDDVNKYSYTFRIGIIAIYYVYKFFVYEPSIFE